MIIGGNAAGMTAASRARRVNPDLKITVLEASQFISYSICGTPYHLSGLVEDPAQLVTFTPESLLAERGIHARIRTRVEEIQPSRRLVVARELATGTEVEISYDRVVLATGYLPSSPAIEGAGLKGVFTISRLEDAVCLRSEIETRICRRAAVIGGGYIGLMMVHALHALGLQVLLFEKSDHVYRQIDPDMAEIIEEELQKKNISLHLSTAVRKLVGHQGRIQSVEIIGKRAQRELFPVDLAIVDVGVVPNVRLALDSGIPCGISGAIEVDGRGQTNVSGVYAAGNCAETVHRVSGKKMFSTLGTTAARQGRVTGENIAGLRTVFPGTLETSLEKLFHLAIGRTGLTLQQSLEAGFDADSAMISGWSRSGYYPESTPIHLKLIFERRGGRALGAQIIGEDAAAKRIDTLATALTAGLTVEQIAQLDLAYAPPYGTLWDPIQIAAHQAKKKLH